MPWRWQGSLCFDSNAFNFDGSLCLETFARWSSRCGFWWSGDRMSTVSNQKVQSSRLQLFQRNAKKVDAKWMQISDHYQIAECMCWIPRPWIVGSPGDFFDPRDSKRVPTMQALKGEKILLKAGTNVEVQPNYSKHDKTTYPCPRQGHPLPPTGTSHLKKN